MRLLLISKESDHIRNLTGLLEEENVTVHPEWAGSLRGKWGEKLSLRIRNRLSERGGEEIDAVLLALGGMPELMELLPELSECAMVPLAVIGSGTEQAYYEELRCLLQGADDYIRPVPEIPVLLLRLQRLIRLYRGEKGPAGYKRGLEETGTDYIWQGKRLGLTQTEYRLLYQLLNTREKVVSREKLLWQVWKQMPSADGYTKKQEAALTAMIRKLREKLSETPIKIVSCYGEGYRIEDRTKEL